MKKMLLILVTAIGFGITANAQDVILKQDGSEIKAKVLEITDQQIKYKEFDFQDGPIRNINVSEVFMITYENGKREIFNKPNETNTTPSKRQSVTNCAKKTAFGLDIGTGGSFYTVPNEKSETLFASALGIRVTHHFNPYFGVDFLKVNWITDVLENFWTMRLQFMPGVRGNSPAFFKCMSVYSAFRLGYGMDFRLLGFSGASHFEGLCLETELGLNITPIVFAGFAYNYHKYFVGGVDSKLAMHTLSFRLGFNFGKSQREVFNKQTSPPIQQRNYQSDLEREFDQISTNDKAMLNFFKRNNFTEYYTKFESACNMRKDAMTVLGIGLGMMGAGGIFIAANSQTTGGNDLAFAGYTFIGIGGMFTIISIPISVVAGGRKRAIKNDFARQYFYTYQPTLNFNCTGNGLGIALKL